MVFWGATRDGVGMILILTSVSLNNQVLHTQQFLFIYFLFLFIMTISVAKINSTLSFTSIDILFSLYQPQHDCST